MTLSELEYSGRIDAEYYKPSYLQYDKIIANKGAELLKGLSQFLIGPFGSAFTVENYTDNKTYRYIRGKDVKPFKLADDDNVYMPKDDYERLIRYALNENDILVSVVGTIGNAALITKKDLPAIFSCKSTVLRPTNINPFYLLTYINTKYGKALLLRKERGVIQKGLNLGDLQELLIYKPCANFQESVEKVFVESFFYLEQSKQTYADAEKILLQEIGLKDFVPSNDPVNIKNLSESFGTSGRLDAEYYQKKYDDYIGLVTNYKHGYKFLAQACTNKGLNFNPDDQQEYQYIELSNIGKSGEINGCIVNQGKDLPSRARRKINTNDVLISSIEGSLDSCALVTHGYENALCSTGFYIINSNSINSETLLVLFKSKPMQAILKQSCSGTILTAINKDEFLNIPVPLIDKASQAKIAILLNESFSLKQQSEHLLEVAKRAVEIAIEQNENEALKYIEENC